MMTDQEFLRHVRACWLADVPLIEAIDEAPSASLRKAGEQLYGRLNYEMIVWQAAVIAAAMK